MASLAGVARLNLGSMMFAVISDIHANFEALQAVVADIDARKVKKIYCLGDIVGYGPQPAECIDLIAGRCVATIMGNHDHAVLYEPLNFNLGAERASFWTRFLFENEPDFERRNKRWKFLGELPIRLELVEHILMVHGSPRRPVNEYIFPDDIYTAPNKTTTIFERIDHLCFVGHTHVPGVFLPDPDFYSPEELDNRYQIRSSEKAIINVGSVGQPRDRDNRAAYALVNESVVEFVRVPYDVEKTVAKINAIPELDEFLGARLREGR